MKTLKEIDLSPAIALMEKVDAMQRELDMEKSRLTELLVNLNLEYYGSSPSDYYKSITKDYHTEDGFYVKIDSGNITLSKKITNILTVTYRDRFYEATSFCISRCSFIYDSGRCIQWSHQKQDLAEKYVNQFKRFEEILHSEQVWNPFIDFGNYISFTDFYKKDIT